MNRVEKWMIRWLFSEWILYAVMSMGAMFIVTKGMTKQAYLYLLFLGVVSFLAGIGSFFAFRKTFRSIVKEYLKDNPGLKGKLK